MNQKKFEKDIKSLQELWDAFQAASEKSTEKREASEAYTKRLLILAKKYKMDTGTIGDYIK